MLRPRPSTSPKFAGHPMPSQGRLGSWVCSLCAKSGHFCRFGPIPPFRSGGAGRGEAGRGPLQGSKWRRTRVSQLTSKKPLRGYASALGHCSELGPHHVFGDPAHPGRSVEAAIGAGHHPSRVTHGACDVFEPVGDDFRVLDKACQIVNDAGGDDLIVGEWEFLQYAILVLMPGIGEGQHESADIGLLEERQYVGERTSRSCGPS